MPLTGYKNTRSDNMTNKDKLTQINKDIDNYNKNLIKLLETVKVTKIDWYDVINDVEYLKHKKQLILFELASKEA